MSAKLDSIKVDIKIPFLGNIKGTWKYSSQEKNAAWEMYIELITRISVVKLSEDDGLLREALSSFHSLFGTTREILRKYGPEVAKLKGKGDFSFAKIAIIILNYVVRPVLARWHPLLLDYENKRAPNVSIYEHEKAWEHNKTLRTELDKTRKILILYTKLLAEVTGTQSLIFDED